MKAMSEVRLNLVVIRLANIEQSALFYQRLGLSFRKHQHGSGLEHFASELDGVTFEIYTAWCWTSANDGLLG